MAKEKHYWYKRIKESIWYFHDVNNNNDFYIVSQDVEHVNKNACILGKTRTRAEYI